MLLFIPPVQLYILACHGIGLDDENGVLVTAVQKVPLSNSLESRR